MTPAALLASLRSRGVSLRYERPAADVWTLFASPAALLTAADREGLRAHKEALLDLLHGEASAACDGMDVRFWDETWRGWWR